MEAQIIQIGNFSYYPQKIIGKGATGCVYKGFRNSDMLPVAVKTIKLSDIDTPVKKHLLNCEVAGLSAVKGNFFCQTYDILKDAEFYFVPMELCPNGTLRDFIKSKGHLNESEAIRIFEKVLEGYCAINKAGFVHRDLKTENILMRSNMEPAIIDMGYCEKIETQGQRLTYNVGSPAYMSPEAYNDNIYSEKSDVWALGVIFHEMLTGTIPVMRTSDIDEYFKYLKNMKTAEIIKSSKNSQTNHILEGCLAVDTRLRFGVKDLEEIFNSQNLRPNLTRTKSVSTCQLITPNYEQTNSPNNYQKPRPQQRCSLNITSTQQNQIRKEFNRLNYLEENITTPQNKVSENQNVFPSSRYQHRGSLNLSGVPLNITVTPMTKKKSFPMTENCKPQNQHQTLSNQVSSPKVAFGIWPEHKFTNMSVSTTEDSQNPLEKSLDLGHLRRKSSNQSQDFKFNEQENPLAQSVDFNRCDVKVRLRKAQSTLQLDIPLNNQY